MLRPAFELTSPAASIWPSGEDSRSSLSCAASSWLCLILPDISQHLAGGYAGRVEGPEALDHDGYGDNGTEDDWQHQPTAGLDNLKHGVVLKMVKTDVFTTS